jgi:Uma2 family endonuclease
MTTAVESLPMVVPADWVPGPKQGSWTDEDYAALPEDGTRYEVIDGILYRMPGPSVPHQTVLSWLIHYLIVHVQLPGLGRVFAAPLDVLLPRARPAQPDVIVVLNHKLDLISERGIEDPPDLVVEIASPGTRTHDRNRKLAVYAAAGIPEYWLAEPADQTIELLALEEGGYRSLGVFTGATILPSRLLSDLAVRVEQFFARRPRPRRADRPVVSIDLAHRRSVR